MTTTTPATDPTTSAARGTHTGGAPDTPAAIDAAFAEAERLWRAVEDRIALLALHRLAHAARALHPDADSITLDWSDQAGTPYLVAHAFRDEEGEVIDYCEDDDCATAAWQLTDNNRHVWEPLVGDHPLTGGFRLIIDTMATRRLPAPLTDTAAEHATGADAAEPTDSAMRSPRIEIVSYRDPDNATELRVFCDGVETTAFEWCEADPGAGHTVADWRGAARSNVDGASPAAAEAIRTYWASGEGSQYVTAH